MFPTAYWTYLIIIKNFFPRNILRYNTALFSKTFAEFHISLRRLELLQGFSCVTPGDQILNLMSHGTFPDEGALGTTIAVVPKAHWWIF